MKYLSRLHLHESRTTHHDAFHSVSNEIYAHCWFLLITCAVHIFITASGINTDGEHYELTCTIQSTDTPTFSWTGPPNGGPLSSGNSDTRMVSDVMSSGSTHTSILQFDPLQSSHEGNYTCQVTVGAITIEMTSFQINVEALVTMKTTQRFTTRPDRSANTEGTAAGGGGFNVAAIVVGVVVGLLVVVILPVMVAVIVSVCIFRRQHSTRNK